MSLYQSLYETALKQGVPRSIIDVMTRVFANDVDFQRATAAGRFARGVLLRSRRHQSAAGAAARFDDGPRSNVQILPLPDARRQHGRLLRRERPLDAQVPGAQADRGGRHDLAVRDAFSSDSALRAHAHRRRLGGADRHADLRRRQWRHHQGGVGWRVRTAGRDPARQRLCDGLQSHVRLRPRDRRGRARPPGPNCRLSRRYRDWRPVRTCTTR